jgi:hypothetical protein
MNIAWPAASYVLPVRACVRPTPEGYLQNHCFQPGLVHSLYIFSRDALFCEEVLHGEGDRRDEGNEVPQRYVGNRFDMVSLVFLGFVVPQADFLGVVQPCFVVGATTSVQDPLSEALSDGLQVRCVRLTVGTGLGWPDPPPSPERAPLGVFRRCNRESQ